MYINVKKEKQKTSCYRQAAATVYAPAPLRRQRRSSFPRPTRSHAHRSHAHRCSRLTRQHGGEQSGLVTLTFELLTLKVVPESRVMWATSANFGLLRPFCSRLIGPMYATDRRQTVRQTDVRQKHRLMPPPIRDGA